MPHGWVQRSPYWASVVEAFHRYEVCGRIGAGGMAEIFLAQEKEPPHRRVALKRLLSSEQCAPSEQDELRAMFIDEARLAMRLTHPSLCRVYDVGVIEGDLVIAMEHVDGVTLADLIDRCPQGLPVPVAVSIIADVAGALDSVHRARDEHGRPLGIVHRDVTPRNVMIDFDGRVKLLDFGLAKSALNHAITRPGMAKGKFAYLAPELWSETRPDARADLFSLGVCLFEALTGTRLYHRVSPFESKAAIVDEPIPSLRDHRPDLPPALDHIVRRCLAKQPHARFESAGALHTALMELLEVMGQRPEPEAVERVVGELFREERERGPELTPTRFGAHASNRPPPLEETSSTSSNPGLAPPILMPASRAPRRGWMVGAAAATLAVGLAVLLAGPSGDEAASAELRVASPAPAVIEPAAIEPAAIEPAVIEAAAIEAADIEPAVVEPALIEAAAIDAPNDPAAGAQAPRRSAQAVTAARPPAAQGALSVNTRPWSEVLVDGRSIGMTPIAEVSVDAGSHALTFLDRDGREHQLTIDVPAGEITRVYRDLQAPAVGAARAEASDLGAPGPS